MTWLTAVTIVPGGHHRAHVLLLGIRRACVRRRHDEGRFTLHSLQQSVNHVAATIDVPVGSLSGPWQTVPDYSLFG
jgi:hypothetical protein